MKLIVISMWFAATACFGQATNPNHLVPISPHNSALGDYDQVVFDALISNRLKLRPELWMISRPSFQPECAVILFSEPENPNKWFLEAATASEPIWHIKEYPKGHVPWMRIDLRRHVKVDRKRIEIDEPSARALRETWSAVIRKTRYADEESQGQDGVVYQFYAHRDHYADGYFGETWSPETGLPAALVLLATHMEELVKSAAEERAPLLKKTIAEAGQLQSQADEAETKTDLRIDNQAAKPVGDSK